ncbi:MAG: hypothetical protein H0V64_07365 [Geodermatophilaceae bacterium]|nr:hypothetical protein [Geodermatophilaceae bacterium]
MHSQPETSRSLRHFPVAGTRCGTTSFEGASHATRCFGPAVAARADWVVVSHTHLSDSGPSAADHAVTSPLVAAGAVLGIPLIAHLLVQPSGSQELVGSRVAAGPAAPEA